VKIKYAITFSFFLDLMETKQGACLQADTGSQ